MSFAKLIKRTQADNFVGRKNERELFERYVVASDSHYPLIFVSGQGGVGKTTLLGQFQSICLTQKLPYGLTNHLQTSVLEVMSHLSQQFTQNGYSLNKFNDCHHKLLLLQEKIAKEPDQPDIWHNLFGQAVGKSVIVAGRATPITSVALDLVGTDIVKSSFNSLANYLTRKLSKQGDVRLMLNPKEVLTKQFLADLSGIASQQPVVLFFDTFEATSSYLHPWVTQLFNLYYGDFSDKIRFVFAGRNFDDSVWLDLRGVLNHIDLTPFTYEETKIYLNHQGVTTLTELDQIYHLSKGLPVFVAMLTTSGIEEASELSQSVIERFLQNISDKTRRDIALKMALPRRFNQDTLRLLFPESTESIPDLFHWLIGMPFVKAQGNYWSYHDVVRNLMVRHQYTQSPDIFQSIHEKLYQFFKVQTEKQEYDETTKKWANLSVWWEDYLEMTYHSICVNPTNEVLIKTSLAEIVANVGFDETLTVWANTLTQAAIDINNNSLNELGNLVKDITISFVSYYNPNEIKRMQKSELSLFATLSQVVDFDSQPYIGARIYYYRGGAHYQLKLYEQAIEDYSQAIDIYPNGRGFYGMRGKCHTILGQYQQAIKDFDKAVTLQPGDAFIYKNRGDAYAGLKEFELAFNDYNEAILLDPNYAQAHRNRGIAYADLEQYEQAIKDLSKAIRLNPPYLAHYYVFRGKIYNEMEQYQQAILDFDMAIDFGPDESFVYKNRGDAYIGLKKFKKAFADYNKAIRLNPTYFQAYRSRGIACNQLEQYEQAIDNFNEAIRLNPKEIKAFYNRALAQVQRNEIELAITDLQRTFELEKMINSNKYLMLVQVDSNLDLIRNNSQFKALLSSWE